MSRVRHSYELWKSVENASGFLRPGEPPGFRPGFLSAAPDGFAPAPVRACSACAGDYEDPDRTAGNMDPSEEDEADEAQHEAQGFRESEAGFPADKES